MATVSKWTPYGVALDITATGGTVTRKTATQFTVVINASWETYYSGAQTNYGMSATSGGTTKVISSFGTKRSSGSGSFTGTYSISGNGAATKTVTVTFKNYEEDSKGNVTKSASKNVTFNVSVPAWTSYTVTYNANGGTGAPGKQTKWKDQALTLSSTKPTRTGHSFLGWSTSSTATSATYSAGGTLPKDINANTTLYAVWKANTYSVTYNANGGSGAPGKQTKTYGVALTLSSVKPTRTNYTFKGWATSASATTAAYQPGGSYTTNAALTLYAVWELSYKKPSITNIVIERDEAGDTIYVDFSWTTYKPATYVAVEFESSEGLHIEQLYNGLGKQTYNESMFLGGLNPEIPYTIRIIVDDELGSWTVSRSVPGLVFAMDIMAQAKGVSFGKAAELAGYADFGYYTRHRNGMEFDNGVGIFGISPDGDVKKVFDPQNGNGNTVIGYDNYDSYNGNTNLYGFDVHIGVSNVRNKAYYRPYLRLGDSITMTVKTAGYVTNSKQDVTFTIPLSIPVVGNTTITVTSNNGFVLRQGDKYTHGSAADVYVTPDSYSVAANKHYYLDNTWGNYSQSTSNTLITNITVTAKFSNVTNATNNDAIGILWNGTITFS